MTTAWGLLPLFAVAVLAAPDEALAPVQDTNATRRVVGPHNMAALQKRSSALGHDPSYRGRFLDKKELEPITSIRCLKEKQRHPDRPCSELRDGEKRFFGAINMGHFPHWQQPVCHSNQEFFCDPENLLKPQEQTDAQKQLQLFKERTLVNCGEFSPSGDPHSDHWYDAESKTHVGRLGLEDFRPFNLAVVVADEWPSNEMDPKSIEYFGRMVMTQWGLSPIYNGVDNENGVNQFSQYDSGNKQSDLYYRTCPNTAVIFILPRSHEAFLVAPNCDFICQSRGGPEVVAAVLAGLDRGGLQEAIRAGVDEAGKALQATSAFNHAKAPVPSRWNQGHAGEVMRSEESWAWAIRFWYGVVISLAVIGVAAFVYFVLLPGQEPRSSRSAMSAMTSVNGRKEIQRAYMEG